MPTKALAPHSSKAAVIVLNDERRRRLVQEIRSEVATVAGLEALALKALADGEATEEDLENMATLARDARKRMETIGMAIASLATHDTE